MARLGRSQVKAPTYLRSGYYDTGYAPYQFMVLVERQRQVRPRGDVQYIRNPLLAANVPAGVPTGFSRSKQGQGAADEDLQEGTQGTPDQRQQSRQGTGAWSL